jgi:hypothetical protein
MCNDKKRTYGIELEGYTDENIRGNHIGQGWKVIEDGSLNDGTDECCDCDGRGHNECYRCDGRGNVDCDDCCGSGEVPCGECDCTGYIECHHCDGEGGSWVSDDEGDEDWVECEHCEGNKTLDCNDCNGSGYTTCETCDGDGEIECESCDGNGSYECESCDGRGSHGDGEYYGVECVSGILTEGDYEPINHIFDYIERYDWTIEDDCGTHVHIGGDDLNEKDLSKLYILANILEPAIYGSLPSNRINGTYAKHTQRDMAEYLIGKGEDITLQQLADYYYGYSVRLNGHFQKYDSARYYGLNLNSWFYRKTIEFRYFEGAINREKANNWIELCIKLVDFAKYTTFEQLMVIGKDFYLIDNLQELLDKTEELLGLEYNIGAYSNYAYQESKHNVASQFRDTHIITRAV